jgi:hypothetical protein
MTQTHAIPSHSPHLPDRRGSSRFPFQEVVRYRLLGAKAATVQALGKTIDMSSGGVFFTTEGELPHGKLIELSVNWPARLGGVCPLQFVAVGRVVRSDGSSAVVHIRTYQFKTRKSGA